MPSSCRTTCARRSFRGHDGDGRGLRYLEWSWDPDPADTTYIADYAYLLRDAEGSVRVERDRHIEGLFARQTWLDLLSDVGFEASVVPYETSDEDIPVVDVFVAKKPED